jgi:hypothetical protein
MVSPFFISGKAFIEFFVKSPEIAHASQFINGRQSDHVMGAMLRHAHDLLKL